jgi:GAF domain-containing protein
VVDGSDPRCDRSSACLPLVVEGRAIGGLSLVFSNARRLDDDERTFLAVLARYAAQALDRADLVEHKKRSHPRPASALELDELRRSERRLQSARIERLSEARATRSAPPGSP